MIFSSHEHLEDKIVRILLEKKHTAKELLTRINTGTSTHISSQGVYKTLKNLCENEVILKRSFYYSIHEEWRRRVGLFFITPQQPLVINEGEKLRFEFISLTELDHHWKNIVLPIQDSIPGFPIFGYGPHHIWINLDESRKESEHIYHTSFLKEKRYSFSVLGGTTIHDTYAKKFLENEFVQISLGKKLFPDTDYPVVFNDYIVTAKLPKNIAQKIELLHEQEKTTESLNKKLAQLELEKMKIKLIIERDKEKAKRFRKKISVDFYIPKKLRDEFDLF